MKDGKQLTLTIKNCQPDDVAEYAMEVEGRIYTAKLTLGGSSTYLLFYLSTYFSSYCSIYHSIVLFIYRSVFPFVLLLFCCSFYCSILHSILLMFCLSFCLSIHPSILYISISTNKTSFQSGRLRSWSLSPAWRWLRSRTPRLRRRSPRTIFQANGNSKERSWPDHQWDWIFSVFIRRDIYLMHGCNKVNFVSLEIFFFPSQTCDIQAEGTIRKLTLKNCQVDQSGEVSYQALNAVTSAMLTVKGKWHSWNPVWQCLYTVLSTYSL